MVKIIVVCAAWFLFGLIIGLKNGIVIIVHDDKEKRKDEVDNTST